MATQTMVVTCQICNKVLTTVQKETILPGDLALYRQMVLCDVDGPTLDQTVSDDPEDDSDNGDDGGDGAGL